MFYGQISPNSWCLHLYVPKDNVSVNFFSIYLHTITKTSTKFRMMVEDFLQRFVLCTLKRISLKLLEILETPKEHVLPYCSRNIPPNFLRYFLRSIERRRKKKKKTLLLHVSVIFSRCLIFNYSQTYENFKLQ